MISDWMLEVLVAFFSWFGRMLPRIPGNVRDFVDSATNGLSGLLTDVPYLSLFPLGHLATAVAAVSVAQVTGIGIRTTARIFAWVRSRGGADE